MIRGWWCAFVLALSLVGGTAFAETIPATAAGGLSVAATQGHKAAGPSGTAVVYDSLGEACNAQRTYPYGVLSKGSCNDVPITPWSPGNPTGTCYYNNTGTNCAAMAQAQPIGEYKCPTGYSYQGGTCKNTALACPLGGGWTLSGSNCTRPDCAAGQVRENGVCVAACGTDGATLGANGICVCPGDVQRYNETSKTCYCDPQYSFVYKGRSIGGTGTAPASACYEGCTVTLGGVSIEMGGSWVSEVRAITGAKCSGTSVTAKTPTSDTRTPEQKCLAAGGGYITGSTGTVCTTAADSPAPVTSKTSSETQTKDSNGAVTGTTEVVTSCTGDQCTTVTTVKNAAGAVVSSSTTTGSRGSGNDTGVGSGQGAGGGGGGDGETDCDKYPDTIGCSEYGEPGGSEVLGTKEVGVSQITAASLASNDSCPPDVNVRNGIKVSYEYICMYARALKPIIIALAWLTAGFMVFGMRID